MLEVKNPVSREITGMPKKAYWAQMEIQMEVWDLNECDFLETVSRNMIMKKISLKTVMFGIIHEIIREKVL